MDISSGCPPDFQWHEKAELEPLTVGQLLAFSAHLKV